MILITKNLIDQKLFIFYKIKNVNRVCKHIY